MLIYKLDENYNVVPGDLNDLNDLNDPELIARHNVGKDQVGPYLVSTVFLTVNLSYSSKPVYFETMIFCDNNDDPFDQSQRRYERYEQALVAHHVIVAYLKDFIRGKVPSQLPF
jgi:hypothetical protein